MDAGTIRDASASIGDANAIGQESELNNINVLEGMSSTGDLMRVLEGAREVLTRVELDLACSSEKLVNLNILTMRVATRESDFEAFVSEKGPISSDSVEKALEFDLLSGILDSEVRGLDEFMSIIQSEIVNACEIVSIFEGSGKSIKKFEEELHDSEESLKQSLEQLSEIRMQSSNFQRILLSSGGEENWEGKGVEFLGNGDFSNLNTTIKMQTFEQQRHVLRMLEKSLARELDLENKVAESRQIEDDFKLRLHSAGQEVFSVEEEAVVACERLFVADNAAEVLLGISRELLGRLHIVQFNLNSSIQREEEMRSKLQVSNEQVKARDSTLQKLESSNAELNDFLVSQTSTLKASLGEAEDKLVVANSDVSTMKDKVSFLEKQLQESEVQLLKEKISKAESRADNAEAMCKLLAETNVELTEEVTSLKSSASTSDKVDSLERQLKGSDIRLQHAVASAEASQEKQSMLYSTIEDMNNLIEDLKSKVCKAEARAEVAEDKCIILSESNADLDEELNFLRGRMECLEASLHHAEETRKATAKDISIRTKLITDLVMQLALERERLHKQVSSLTKENKILVKHLQQTNKDPSLTISHDGKGNRKEYLVFKHDFNTTAKESKEEAPEFSATSFEDELPKSKFMDETEMGPADSTSKLETLRNIDARQLSFKCVYMTVIALVISAVVVFLVQHPNG